MSAKAKKETALPIKAEEREQLKAILALNPKLNAAVLAADFSFHEELNLRELVATLDDRCGSVHGGDLKRVETMLVSQAHSLDVMFTHLARRGRSQEGLRQFETHLKLALKAQSQCRATLETLVAIKNPPIFARQANIAHGPQQVNNDSAGITRAEQIENKPNELLEHDHGQRLDTRTKSTAGGGDQELATVEAIHRPAHS